MIKTKLIDLFWEVVIRLVILGLVLFFVGIFAALGFAGYQLWFSDHVDAGSLSSAGPIVEVLAKLLATFLLAGMASFVAIIAMVLFNQG